MSARSDVLDEKQEKACKCEGFIKQGDWVKIYRGPIECNAEETQNGKDDGCEYDADYLTLLQWLYVLTEVHHYKIDRAANSNQSANTSGGQQDMLECECSRNRLARCVISLSRASCIRMLEQSHRRGNGLLN